MLLSLALWPQADASRGRCNFSLRRIPTRSHNHPVAQVKEGLGLSFKCSQTRQEGTLSLVGCPSPSESLRTLFGCPYSFLCKWSHMGGILGALCLRTVFHIWREAGKQQADLAKEVLGCTWDLLGSLKCLSYCCPGRFLTSEGLTASACNIWHHHTTSSTEGCFCTLVVGLSTALQGSYLFS